jgi:hypothetical protein
VNFSEQPPSEQWATLKYRGERLAEVWFKPEGEPFALTFRVPRETFQIPGMGQRLTTGNLLKAVGIATEEVESWRHGGASHSGMDGANPEFGQPLPPPPQDVTHLSIYVSLKPPPRGVAPAESGEPEVPSAKWRALEGRWKAILASEAAIDHLRLRMEAVHAEMEASLSRALTTEEKTHALNADVAQWTKAKSRAHHGLPKAREFIHRATWATGTPERKRLAELFKHDVRPDIPLPQMDKVAEELERLLKVRQVLAAQGATVYQQSKRIAADVQGALRTLQGNAAANALRKRAKAGARSKRL